MDSGIRNLGSELGLGSLDIADKTDDGVVLVSGKLLDQAELYSRKNLVLASLHRHLTSFQKLKSSWQIHTYPDAAGSADDHVRRHG